MFARPSSAAHTSRRARLRIALIAPTRYPIREPFAGGLEACVWTLGHALVRRGHDVTVFAAAGSDPTLNVVPMATAPVAVQSFTRGDIDSTQTFDTYEVEVYEKILDQIRDRTFGRFDVVHNHSLHSGPITGGPFVGVPMLSTLHTPPFAQLEKAVAATLGTSVTFTAVSRCTARSWSTHVPDLAVISNGVDTDRWRPGPGGGPLVWSGRIVPEKAPHRAIDAARAAGLPLVLAGAVIDRAYLQAEVLPRLGDGVSYLGHLDQTALSAVVRHASAALVTPDWDEPYGLVVAEALASGTPVVSFARGGIPEIVDATSAVLVAPGDVAALAEAIPAAVVLSRTDARSRAVGHCSLTRMVDRYEDRYDRIRAEAA